MILGVGIRKYAIEHEKHGRAKWVGYAFRLSVITWHLNDWSAY